jgi:hypothetical protein
MQNPTSDSAARKQSAGIFGLESCVPVNQPRKKRVESEGRPVPATWDPLHVSLSGNAGRRDKKTANSFKDSEEKYRQPPAPTNLRWTAMSEMQRLHLKPDELCGRYRI